MISRLKYTLYNFRYALTHLSFRKSKSGVITLVIDESKNHPGIVDRLKAIVCMYDIARRNGMVFKLAHQCRFNLIDYLVPNTYDWVTDTPVPYSIVNSKMVDYEGDKEIPHLNNQKNYILYNYKGKNYLQKKGVSKWPELWKQRFDELFTPSPLLLKSIQEHQNYIGGSYVAVHFRFVNVLEQFEVGHKSAVPANVKNQIIDASLQALKEIQEANPECKVVVFSDSNVFRTIASRNGYIITPGEVCHSSFNNNDKATLKTFTDIYVISKAEKVYRIDSKYLYKTMFSYYAAIIGGKNCIDYPIDRIIKTNVKV